MSDACSSRGNETATPSAMRRCDNSTCPLVFQKATREKKKTGYEKERRERECVRNDISCLTECCLQKKTGEKKLKFEDPITTSWRATQNSSKKLGGDEQRVIQSRIIGDRYSKRERKKMKGNDGLTSGMSRRDLPRARARKDEVDEAETTSATLPCATAA